MYVKKSIGKTETLTTMFVPLDFLNAVVYPSISKPTEEVWDNIVANDGKKARDNGLKGIYELASSGDFNRDRYGDYQYTEISLNILERLLKGNIKTLKELKKQSENQLIENNYNKSIFIYTVLHYTKVDEKTDKEITTIDTIFINS